MGAMFERLRGWLKERTRLELVLALALALVGVVLAMSLLGVGLFSWLPNATYLDDGGENYMTEEELVLRIVSSRARKRAYVDNWRGPECEEVDYRHSGQVKTSEWICPGIWNEGKIERMGGGRVVLTCKHSYSGKKRVWEYVGLAPPKMGTNVWLRELTTTSKAEPQVEYPLYNSEAACILQWK